MKRKIASIAVAVVLSLTMTSCVVHNGSKTEPYGIAATSVTICEILNELNIDSVVGVPETSGSLPERYQQKKTIGSPMSPDLEVLSQINPEYVLTPKSLEASLSVKYDNAGLNSYFMNLSSVEGMYESIEHIGSLFGKEAEAATLKQGYTSYMENYTKKSCDTTVLILMCYPDGFYLVATADSYVGNIVKLSGANNVYGEGYVGDGTGVASVSPEDMVKKNPDKILVFAHYNEESAFKYMEKDFKTDANWQNYDAVKNGEVYYLSTNDGFGMSANLQWTTALDYLKPIFYGA